MRFYYEKQNGFRNEHDQTCYSTPGMMSTLAHIDNCQCDDGKRRSVRITGHPDTFFSVPAECTVKGKTVSGFITTVNGEYWFHATGKNRKAIKKTLCQCQARHCSTCGGKSPKDKYKKADLSLIAPRHMMQSLCASCAGLHWDNKTWKTSCEQSEIESDNYYGAQIGMTGAEYKAYITKQYEQTTEAKEND